MTLPDRFIDHDSPNKQYADSGLDSIAIVATALAALGQEHLISPARA
jgi:1-deoxy-D-xylulose-5-phosphate synthase